CGPARPVRPVGKPASAARGTRPARRERAVATRGVESARGVEEAARGGTMRGRTLALAGLLAVGPPACRQAPPAEQSGSGAPGVPPDQEPPVALNADSPIQYPPRLYDQKVEGDVMLRLFVDSVGRLLPESRNRRSITSPSTFWSY